MTVPLVDFRLRGNDDRSLVFAVEITSNKKSFSWVE
jgi:hypothetical protein